MPISKSLSDLAEQLPAATEVPAETPAAEAPAVTATPETTTVPEQKPAPESKPTKRKSKLEALVEEVEKNKATKSEAPAEPPAATPAEETPEAGAGEDIPQWKKDFISELNDEPAAPEAAGAEAPEKPAEAAAEPVKTTEADPVYEHPLVKFVAESIKGGVTDPKEILSKIGSIADPASVSIEQIYREQAQQLGLEGDELDEAVEEQMVSFNSKTRIDQKKEESALRSQYQKSVEEKLNAFTTQATQGKAEEAARFQAIAAKADEDLNQLLEGMKGKNYKSLIVDDAMLKALPDVIRAYSPPIIKDGVITGYDIKEGRDVAMWKLYGKQLLKSTYDLGRSSGYDEAINVRNRPSPNDTSPGGSSPIKANGELETAMGQLTKDLWGKRGFKQS